MADDLAQMTALAELTARIDRLNDTLVEVARERGVVTRALLAAGWTPREIGSFLGVTRQSVTKWAATRNPDS